MLKTVIDCPSHATTQVELTAAEEEQEKAMVVPPIGPSEEQRAAHDAIHREAQKHPKDPVLQALDVLFRLTAANIPGGGSDA